MLTTLIVVHKRKRRRRLTKQRSVLRGLRQAGGPRHNEWAHWDGRLLSAQQSPLQVSNVKPPKCNAKKKRTDLRRIPQSMVRARRVAVGDGGSNLNFLRLLSLFPIEELATGKILGEQKKLESQAA